MANQDILGQGWSFPPQFDHNNKAIIMSDGVEDIVQSLEILFTTELGERIMQPEYGCALTSMQMEPLNTGNIGYIKHLIETGILYHESRIDLQELNLDFETRPGYMMINIAFTIRQTNSRHNYVYPFYLQEV